MAARTTTTRLAAPEAEPEAEAEAAVRVLVVEDEPKNLAAVVAVLGDLGIGVAQARSGPQALRALLGEDFAVIILDVRMPGMDGFEAARLIRARPRSQKTPIIFLTAIDKHDRDVRRGYALGAVDYLFKPVDPEILRAKVRVLADLHLRTEEVRRQTVRIHRLEQVRLLEQQRAEHERALLEAERAAKTLLEHKAKELERSNEELEQFAYVASHDLQEPLRMVAAYTELLSKRYKGRLDADADDFIRYAAEGARRMRDLIADLLELSRVGTHGRPFVPTNVGDVIAEAMHALEVAITESGAEIDRPPELPTVDADGPQLVQVFQNLIGNAIKFRGEARARIKIDAKRENDEWRFSVCDNGIGIEQEYFGRIFRMFQRLHERSRHEGSGIGLAIVRKIVERHRGRVWVESVVGTGSTFHFTLPARA